MANFNRSLYAWPFLSSHLHRRHVISGVSRSRGILRKYPMEEALQALKSGSATRASKP